ncbi:MAG: hypothetical protein SVX43_16715 [Cyanobacteriota bacterium]|nr:hypothetical protein [Cyanobacteriota bacterium]
MNDPTTQAIINQTAALILYYGFETGEATAVVLVADWLDRYQPIWVRLAVIEALYQGRYKAVSIEQILSFWVRRGQPTYHFNHEFERLVCRKIPLFPTGEEQREQIRRVLAAAASQTAAELDEETFTSRDVLADFLQAEKPVREMSISELSDGEKSAIATEPKPFKSHHRPIHKFTPPPDGSDFYHKLKNISGSTGLAL